MTSRVWRILPSLPENEPGNFMKYEGASQSLSKRDRSRIPVAPEHLPFLVSPYPGSGELDEIPAFARGPMSSDIVVRESFKTLLEEMDPLAGYFAPMVMVLPDGERLADMFWRFESINPIDAMIPEKSTVQEAQPSPGRYNWKGGRTATFDRARIGQRHLWSVSNLISGGIYASNELFEEMQGREMGPFQYNEMLVE